MSTSSTCACSSNYSPASCEDGSGDGVGAYGLNEACTFTLTGIGTLSVAHFNPEPWYDRLTVDGIQYDGTTGPEGLGTAGPLGWAPLFSADGYLVGCKYVAALCVCLFGLCLALIYDLV